MNTRLMAVILASAMMYGCATPPAGDATLGGASSAADDADRISSGPKSAGTDLLEERHRVRAQAYARESNWADTLIHWELLALLRPNAQEYKEAIADTRARIKTLAAAYLRGAELARKQDNLDQATLLYLRALYVERDNATAAQALREIDAERNKRAYANRPPRMRM
jgi:hypothetical protein